MRIPVPAVLASLAAAAASAAQAQEPTVPPEVQALFPVGEEACYGQSFTESERRPGQTLSAFYLFRSFEPDPTQEAVALERSEAIAFDRRAHSETAVDVVARFSDSPHPFTQTVFCDLWEGEGRKVYCGVECDGGYFMASPSDQGLRAGFATDSGGLSLNQSCGDTDEEGRERWLKPIEAGGNLELKRQPIAQCREAAMAARPGYAADPVSLRERVESSGWRCLRRSYDKAHLAKHKNQKVTAIAVAVKAPARAEREDAWYPETLLDVELSFRLRSGKEVRRDVVCRADSYQFRCDGGFRLRRRDEGSAWLVAGEYDDPARPPVMLDTTLGSDDRLFRLEAAAGDGCGR